MIAFLDRYVSEELPETQRREFDWHLRLCRSCRAYLHTYRDTILLERKVLASDETRALLEMPEELVAAIVAASRT
jgi:anti-sigma factor RsiW